jgi:hypothetical protein
MRENACCEVVVAADLVVRPDAKEESLPDAATKPTATTTAEDNTSQSHSNLVSKARSPVNGQALSGERHASARRCGESEGDGL